MRRRSRQNGSRIGTELLSNRCTNLLNWITIWSWSVKGPRRGADCAKVGSGTFPDEGGQRNIDIFCENGLAAGTFLEIPKIGDGIKIDQWKQNLTLQICYVIVFYVTDLLRYCLLRHRFVRLYLFTLSFCYVFLYVTYCYATFLSCIFFVFVFTLQNVYVIF